MIGFACSAESLVSLVLTDKWLPCVPFVRILCVSYMLWPIHTANLNAIKAMGRSDIFLKMEVIKKVVGIALLVSTIGFSVKAMAYGVLLECVIAQIVNSIPNKSLLNYGYIDQLKDVLPTLALSGVMGIVVYYIGILPLPQLLGVVVQILTGMIIYIVGSYLLRFDEFRYIMS